MEFHQMKGDIGVIGLAVMGQNLILNMNDNGFKSCCIQPYDQQSR